MNQHWRGWALGALVLLSGCQAASRRAEWEAAAARAPLFEGMGNHQRGVRTSSPDAQRYFNQGLTLAFAFNHDEAIRSFEQAAQLDPECAMAWWGIALCNGPHINNPIVPEARSHTAMLALERARATEGKAAPADRALIEALTQRYADPPSAERAPLDAAYANAMREVWRQFPDDPDVGVLFAEALMDLRPWDLWNTDGQPQPGTEEIIATLDDVIALDPRHPGALHLYIHALEASPHPERANAAADGLRNLVPGAGHLVHMPSHIDVLTGRWALASDQNERAIAADAAYRARAPRQGFYHIYMAHNHHMLAFAAMMEGRGEVALRAARALVAGVPEDYARQNAALVDPYLAIVPEVLMRFGRWDDILLEPQPADYLPITTALWHFTRGVAYANIDRFEQAESERAEFEQAVQRIPPDARMAINPAHDVLNIAAHLLNGEIAYRRGNIDTAVAELRDAANREAQLRYMEPPEWIQPVRHTLAGVLLGAGRLEEAEAAYRADLTKWPENGWSLYGLAQCLEQRGAVADARTVNERFQKAWARADRPIHASCLCIRMAGK